MQDPLHKQNRSPADIVSISESILTAGSAFLIKSLIFENVELQITLTKWHMNKKESEFKYFKNFKHLQKALTFD